MTPEIVYFIRGEKHRTMAELSIASVQKVYGRAKVYTYTDDQEFAPLVGTILCRQHGANQEPRPMMVANLDAQFRHMITSRLGDLILFLDADVLMRKPFPFQQAGADLYPTWRDHIERDEEGNKVEGFVNLMPYNYGVLGACVTPASIEAFCWLRARILQMAKAHQKWYGNQFAIFDLCGHPKSSPMRRICWTTADRGETVLELERLPCEVWNYSPEKPGEDVTDKGILHFKGGRKDLMEAYL